MSNHVVCGQIIPPHKPCHKFDQWLVSFICKLSALIWNLTFYRNGIIVSVIGCIRDLITWNALNDFPTDSNDKMAAGMRLPCLCQTFKITAVLFRRCSRICRIMDDYPIYLRKLCSRSGILIDRQQLYRKIRDSSTYLTGSDTTASSVADFSATLCTSITIRSNARKNR